MTFIDRTIGGYAVKVLLKTQAQLEAIGPQPFDPVRGLAKSSRQVLACLYDAAGVVLFTSLDQIYALPLPIFDRMYFLATAGETSNFPADNSPTINSLDDIRAYLAAALTLSTLVTLSGYKMKRWTAGEFDANRNAWADERRDRTALYIQASIFTTGGAAVFATYEEVLAITDTTRNSYLSDMVLVNGRSNDWY